MFLPNIGTIRHTCQFWIFSDAFNVDPFFFTFHIDWHAKIPVLDTVLLLYLLSYAVAPFIEVCFLSLFFLSFHSFFLSFCFSQCCLFPLGYLSFCNFKKFFLSPFHFKLFFFLSFHSPHSFFSFVFQCFVASFMLDHQ